MRERERERERESKGEKLCVYVWEIVMNSEIKREHKFMHMCVRTYKDRDVMIGVGVYK